MIYGIFLSKEAGKTLERNDRITEGRISRRIGVIHFAGLKAVGESVEKPLAGA